jgi:large subunit ribosomal protein L6
VGYKFEISPLKITTSVGYSHLLSQKWPLVSSLRSRSLNKKATQISFQGSDLSNLNLYAATIRNFRQPDVYKGKGLRYKNDFIKRKEGKKKKIN